MTKHLLVCWWPFQTCLGAITKPKNLTPKEIFRWRILEDTFDKIIKPRCVQTSQGMMNIWVKVLQSGPVLAWKRRAGKINNAAKISGLSSQLGNKWWWDVDSCKLHFHFYCRSLSLHLSHAHPHTHSVCLSLSLNLSHTFTRAHSHPPTS